MRRSQTALLRARSLAVAGIFVLGAALTAGPPVAAAARFRAASTSSPSAAAGRTGLVDRVVNAHGAPDRVVGRNRPSRHVVVKNLPKATGHERVYRSPLRTPIAGTATAPKTQAKAPSVRAVTTASVTTTNPATEEASGSGSTSGVLEPPDPFVAVGPDHVVQATNAGIRITNRSVGGASSLTLSNFFGIDAVGNGYQAETFDPRVIYDSLHNRWVAIESSFDCEPDPSHGINIGTGYIDVAISDTADPTLGWGIASLPYPDTAPDFPGLGTSTDKVVASANVFTLQAGGALGCDINGAGFIGTELDVLNWSQLLGTGNLDVDFLTSYTNPADFPNAYFTLRPSVQMPAATAPVFGVTENLSNAGVSWFKVTGVPNGVAHASVAVSGTFTGSIDAFDTSVPAPIQPGPDTIAGAVDGRPTDAIWQNNRLVFVSTRSCDPAGGATEDRDCVRVSEIGVSSTTSAPPITQDMMISEDGRDLYMGGVGLAQNGDLHVTWTGSSATGGDFPSTYTAYQVHGTTANALTGKQKIASGTSAYGGERWGDYVGLAQDPRVPDAVWQAAGYSTGATWSTRVSQLRTFGGASYVAITPLRVLDS
ncbi:MAG TPA: hypothetical protein VGO64_03005, partial [Candidatus Limnocylindrales bacterium]|nr:hypothetical protein [Candidatus Limnocylindrales bacterium]